MNQKYKIFPNAATGFISDEDTKKYFSRLGFAVCGLLLAKVLSEISLSLIYAAIINAIVPVIKPINPYWADVLLSPTTEALSNDVILAISNFAVALPIFLAISKPLPKVSPFKAKMNFKNWLGGFCIAMLLFSVGGYISNVILISIESMLNITTSNPVGESMAQSSIWQTLIFTVILFPILEEILFRKIVCDRLLPLGEGYAVFVSAAIFGLVHGNFYQFAYAFLVGMFFAFIYVKTGKLIYSTIYHILLNFIGTIVSSWIVGLIDVETLNKLLETGVIDINDPATAALMESMYIILAYEAVIMAFYIIGLVLIFKARKKNLIKLESGLLPPPKQHRFANIFLTTGVASAIALFVFIFMLSLIP